jgi:hypothetical protein
MNTDFDLLNTESLDESILNNTYVYSSADGEQEYEDEENTDSEPSDEEGVYEEELPKYRTLVKNKKLELKAQYGKARIVMERQCNRGIPYPCPTKDNLRKICYKEVCVNVPKTQWGWRKKWREFKQAGGLAKLKMQARGLAPIEPTVTPPTTAAKTLTFRGKALAQPTKVTLGKTTDVKDFNENQNDMSTKRVAETNDKILGMPKMVAIGIGVAILALGGFIIYKKINK